MSEPVACKYAGADWLQTALQYVPAHKGKTLSPLARQVADILGQVFRGLYHLKDIAQQKWFEPWGVQVHLRQELATYDGWELSALVVLCHDAAIRLAISAVSVPYSVADDDEGGDEAKALYDTIGEYYDDPEDFVGQPMLQLTFHQRRHDGRHYYDRHLTMEQTVSTARHLGAALVKPA